MLEPNFQPPDPELSKRETEKRLEILPKITHVFQHSSTAILVSGSLAYGANYSLTEKSDIDLQVLIDKDTVTGLSNIIGLDKSQLEHAIDGYLGGYYHQFSMDMFIDDIKCECHFWDAEAFYEAISYKSQSTPRLRQSIETPSKDFGFSFDGDQNEHDYYGEFIESFAVSDFPSYRRIENKMYLCRPITNILGKAMLLKTNDELDQAIKLCWQTTKKELTNFQVENPHVETSIFNALPGKNKVSPEIKEWIDLATSM